MVTMMAELKSSCCQLTGLWPFYDEQFHGVMDDDNARHKLYVSSKCPPYPRGLQNVMPAYPVLSFRMQSLMGRGHLSILGIGHVASLRES